MEGQNAYPSLHISIILINIILIFIMIIMIIIPIAIEKMLRNVNPSPPPSKPSTVKCVTTWNQQIHLIFSDDDDLNNNDVGDDQMKMDGKLYWCNQKEDVVGIGCSTKISRTRETSSQHQMSCMRAGDKQLFSMKLLVFIILCWADTDLCCDEPHNFAF